MQQLALDLQHDLGPRLAAALLVDHGVVVVEVMQVVRRHDAEPLHEGCRQPGRARDTPRVLVVEQRLQDVVAVEPHADLPGQVIQAEMVELDALGLDVEDLREVALEDHCGAAQADGLVPVVEQRLRHDADWVREVDDPCVRGAFACALGDLEDDRNRAQRFGEAAEACRLLPDAAAGDRNRLVDDARRLAADTNLDEHGVGSLDGFVEARRRVQARGLRGALEHPLRKPGHDLESLLVRVVQEEIVDGHQAAQPYDPVDHLGRVRRAGADHRELHPSRP
jgi:hypothetical protein